MRLYTLDGPGSAWPSSMIDVNGAWFHSYLGPGAEVKEHFLCNRRRVLVSTARQQYHLTTTLRRSITTNDRRQYRRSSGTTITQAHLSYINGNIFGALAPSPSLLRPPISPFPRSHHHHNNNNNNNNNRMWQQIKDLFRLCFGERDHMEQPARPRNPTRPALRRASFS
jgi:hypothetical protein